MADAAARKLQYEYKANSNLVLTADKSLIDRRPRNEATGEVVSLVGHLGGIRMGDRCMRGKPGREDLGAPLTKKSRLASSLLSSEEFDFVGLTYKPKTQETAQTYEALLTYIHSWLGDQPRDVLCGAAEEVLLVLRNDRLRDREKRAQVESLMGLRNLPDDRLAVLIGLSKKLVDWTGTTENAVAVDDDVEGVNVQFDESGDEAVDMVEEEEEVEDDELETVGASAIGLVKVEQERNENVVKSIDPREIDAYWLQRQLAKAYDDPSVAQSKAQQVLEVLRSSKDERDLENQLVILLGFAQFELIKTLRLNRNEVLYSILLASAQTMEDKEKIVDEMRGDPELDLILRQISEPGIEGKVKSVAIDTEMEICSDGGEVEKKECTEAPPNVLNFEDLTFSQGCHFMANRLCQLPEGSFRKQRTGYEEVHVPAPKPKPFTNDEKLISVEELPAYVRPAFEGFTALNRVQSRISSRALHSDENLLVCAPTGAGKTNVALLAIMREVGKNTRPDGTICTDTFKVIYIAPMRSLVQEMVGNFSRRLACYGLKVSELTGDHQLTKQEIDATQVIVCTPEKWDIVTRKGGDRVYTQIVRLLIIDEIHLLHDDRGPVLEAIVARTLRNIESNQMDARFIGLSATLPNVEDIARFLRVNPDSGLFSFDNSYRPVPLEQQYIGITEKKAVKRYQLMNDLTYEKVIELSGSTKQQVLIFVHSRKETTRTAKWIRDKCMSENTIGSFLRDGSASMEILKSEAEQTSNLDLKDLLPYGFGIHNAGLSRVDRTLVEDLFADRHINVLVSTATLAWGVNLPAHAVIIKGTQVYSPERGRWVELGALDVMQMLGRAGRPQFDRRGVGVLLTTYTQLQYYLSLMNQQLPIESQLIARLVDNLNAELVLGTIHNSDDAVQWLKYTYLYIRMLRNPVLYGIELDEIDSDPYLVNRRKDLIHTACLHLSKSGLLKYDPRNDHLDPSALGRISSHYYVTADTMQVYNQLLRSTVSEIELLRIFALSSEFRNIRVREEEKLELAKLIERVPFPVKEAAEEPSAKVNVLLQAHISQLHLDGFSLASDMIYVTQSASRLVRALFEIVLSREWAQLAERCLNLAKMIDRRMWQSMCPLRQFKKIPEEIVRKLERKIIPWERFYDMGPHELGELIRAPKLGKSLYRYIHEIPRLECSIHVLPVTRSMLQIELSVRADFEWDEKVHGRGAESFWVFVEDVDSERLLHYEYFLLKAKYTNEEHLIKFYVSVYEPVPPQYFVKIISDRWLTGQQDTTVAISFRHLILPEKFTPCTDLLDLRPLPKSALGCKWLEESYDWAYFNPIQTQVFNTVYNTDENVFVGAPVGCGKTVLAEIAIYRALSSKGGRCAYVHSRPEIVAARFEEFKERFKNLGVHVAKLTGHSQTDLKVIATSGLIVSTANHWDSVSKRWKQRKSIQTLKLFVIDDLHLVGFSDGPVIEAICSRMRYISSQVADNQMRILALSASTANLRDISSWLACSKGAFNFHPSVRPQRLNIRIQAFNQSHTPTRLLTMSRHVYTAAVQCGRESVIVFVSSRRQTKLTCVDMLAYSVADGQNLQFLSVEKSEDLLASIVDKLNDEYLGECLKHGIGYVHEGSSHTDELIVFDLFTSAIIKVLVVTQSICWRLNSLHSYMVILSDTSFYNGQSHSYEDYPMCDILEMCGRATHDALVLTERSKAEYLQKFLYDPLPIESHLTSAAATQGIHDHFNAEIVAHTIESKQDAVDYLTWTLMYRRMTQNPNYYNLAGLTHRHLSDHLSQLVESVLSDLAECKCIQVDEFTCSPLNLAMICSYYSVSYRTIELLSRTLSPKTKSSRTLLELVSNAAEFDDRLPVRHREDVILKQLTQRLPETYTPPKNTNDPIHLKAHALIYGYLARLQLPAELERDADFVIALGAKLLHASVDVLSSSGYLTSALVAMETVQMIVQAVWPGSGDSGVLRQIPHFNEEIVDKCRGKGVFSVFDLMEMDDDERLKLLQESLRPRQVSDVARFCNAYPNVDFGIIVKSVSSQGDVVSELKVESDEDEDGVVECMDDGSVCVEATLEREQDDEGEQLVVAPFFPNELKDEGWWLIVGHPHSNRLLAIRRVSMGNKSQVRVQLDVANPLTHEGGSQNETAQLKVYLMSDSYLGCDQEHEFKVTKRNLAKI